MLLCWIISTTATVNEQINKYNLVSQILDDFENSKYGSDSELFPGCGSDIFQSRSRIRIQNKSFRIQNKSFRIHNTDSWYWWDSSKFTRCITVYGILPISNTHVPTDLIEEGPTEHILQVIISLMSQILIFLSPPAILAGWGYLATKIPLACQRGNLKNKTN